jgi:hypothetical protein
MICFSKKFLLFLCVYLFILEIRVSRNKFIFEVVVLQLL